MPYIKKLAIAPFFLVSLVWLITVLEPVFKSYTFIISFSAEPLFQILVISAAILAVALTFVLFVAIASDPRLILPIIAISVLPSFILIPQPLNLVFAIGTSLSFLLIMVLLLNKLKTYITFSASGLLGPSINQLALLLTIVICFGYYLSTQEAIQKNGFQIPDALVESLINLSSSMVNVKGVKYLAQSPALTPEQIQLLKQNPEILKQYGIDPKDLDSLQTGGQKPKTASSSGLQKSAPLQSEPLPMTIPGLDPKVLVKNALESALKPYLGLIAGFSALGLLSMMLSFNWILGFFITPVIKIIFYILEKSGFITFTKEMREVKKMAV